jgi:hypothetical protein
MHGSECETGGEPAESEGGAESAGMYARRTVHAFEKNCILVFLGRTTRTITYSGVRWHCTAAQ